MTTTSVPIKFVVGSRKLLSVSRVVQTCAFGLDELVAGTVAQWPAIGQGVQGLRVLSAPYAQFDAIRARYPGYLIGGFQRYERYYIEMANHTYEDYLGQFSSKTRSTFSRKRRKLADMTGGVLDIREFHREEDVDAFASDAVALSQRTYQTRLLDAGLPEGPEAILGMKALAQKDALRAYILYLDGRAISYLYLPTTGGIVSYAYLGYDPDYAHLSVGTVLQMDVLERLFAEARYRYFDFTEGEGAHKKMFGTASVDACTFFLLRPNATNRLLLGGLNAFDGGIAMAKQLASRSGALARVRQMLRG